MIKKILATIFIILVVWFFIENPIISKNFYDFSKEKISNIKGVISNTTTKINANTNLNVSAGVEAKLSSPSSSISHSN